MNPFDPLDSCLLDLLHELRDTGIRLIIGGGYGLYLKHRHLRQSDARSLLFAPAQARSTNDLDLFLHPEVLALSEQAGRLAAALDRLGYESIPSRRFTQFLRRIQFGDQMREVKLDLLTGPRECFAEYPHIRTDERRVKPRPSVNLHAHPTDEAIDLIIEPIEIRIRGFLAAGEFYEDFVLLPQSFTYALMKLFAFRDQAEREDKHLGRHHAFDLYMLIATTTEPEWKTARRLSRKNRDIEIVREAENIVNRFFSDRISLGILRLREHPDFSSDCDYLGFIEILSELFPFSPRVASR